MSKLTELSFIRILLVRLCIFATICGCDGLKSDEKVESAQVKNKTPSTQQRAEELSTINEQPRVTHLGMTWSDHIYDKPLFENEIRKIGINVETDCEKQKLRANVTFQSNEVESLLSDFKNTGANQCEAEIRVPFRIRPMWMQLEVVAGNETELDSLLSICLHVTLRDLAMMDTGDTSLYSMDELASTRLGPSLINKDFVRDGCTMQNYLEYFTNYQFRY